jgi:hypothetical protein
MSDSATPVYIKKADGTLEPFDPAKLAESLENSGGSPTIVERVLAHVSSELVNGMSSADVYRHAFEVLHRESRPAAARYSLRRALTELGPNGFPFEKFVAHIFKIWKYETLTDQIVKGKCVEHETDVVAWNKEKLVMVEAKFHNEFGLKSDLKVALYVKARIDDILAAGPIFDYGGQHRSLSEGWLITNTKFTEQAIKYGSCTGLKMIGWNYPPQGNLHDIIVSSKLHPFTCLANLSNVYKKNLLERGVILCKDITPKILQEAGMDGAGIDAVMHEIGDVCNT